MERGEPGATKNGSIQRFQGISWTRRGEIQCLIFVTVGW